MNQYVNVVLYHFYQFHIMNLNYAYLRIYFLYQMISFFVIFVERYHVIYFYGYFFRLFICFLFRCDIDDISYFLLFGVYTSSHSKWYQRILNLFVLLQVYINYLNKMIRILWLFSVKYNMSINNYKIFIW